MEQQKWKVVLDHTCLLGEGPVWDAASQSILWVDIEQGEIHRFSPEQKVHKTMKIGQMVGAIAPRASGGLIAALQGSFATVDMEKQTLHPIIDPEIHLPDNRFNDGKCDPAGRFWAGTMDYISGKKGAGSLYTLHTDMSVVTRIEGVSCSNGLAWSADHRTLYYIDTPTQQVVAYDYDPESGDIRNKRVVITIPASSGYPDGMTIDTDGMLWVACWDGWRVSRWDPSTGKLLQDILLPAAKITSCTFGGPGLRDLYITSAKTGLNAQQLKEQPLAGSLFVIKNTGFTGHLPFAFKG
ncbi:SMP-30/gluconolactonase/LRE family protein [Chitinophaga defluvii]|uniref:Regucalcin n=1 Tax=Chitinophaga defluvii TaxID=3163343 RepID=A0ABV2SZ07_9BACT